MRTKLRPENESLNWTYAVKLVGEPSPIIFDTGHKMNRLWNDLVAMHNRLPYQLLRSVERMFIHLAKEAKDDERTASYLFKASEVREAAQAVAKESYRGFSWDSDAGTKWTAPLVAATIAARRANDEPLLDIPFEQRINYHTQERGNELGLPVWSKWYVGDTFKNALKAYAKRIRFAPRFKRGLDAIHIEQRTNSGAGWPASKLFERRAAFSIKPETERGGDYDGWEAPGWFKIGAERIPLRLIMHRPFPSGAIVKRYSLVGHYEKSAEAWEWRMVFQLEVPPVRVLYPVTNRIVAIDAGWRVHRERAICEGDIRAMTIYDGHQAYEYVIPFDLSNARERRPEYAGKPRIDLRETWEIKSRRAGWLESCKDDIRKLDVSAWPDRAIRALSGLTKMRDEGLLRIREMLEAEGLVCEPIEAWQEKDSQAWRQQRHIERRWIESRNSLWRQWAAELAEQCDVIIWEGDLDLRNMAEQAGKRKAKRKADHSLNGDWEERTIDERTLEAAAKWRVMASLSQARLWIREAMAKRVREIIDDQTAWSSQICSICNGRIEPSPQLMVECENGHRMDQDVNTCRYYWDRLEEDVRAAAVPLAPVNRSQLWRCVRPINH